MLSITFYCLTSPLTVLFYIVIAITELHATSFLWRYMSTGAIISTLRIHSLCEQSCNAFLWCRVAFWARGVSNSTLLIYIKLATLCNNVANFSLTFQMRHASGKSKKSFELTFVDLKWGKIHLVGYNLVFALLWEDVGVGQRLYAVFPSPCAISPWKQMRLRTLLVCIS